MKDKILITGAAGFIGSHLTELMTKKGYKVVAFDRYNSNNDHGWLNNSPYKKDFEFILGDIRDYDSVNNASKGCSGVMHLAALIGIPYSYFSPIAYVKTNIEGTYNLLEASKNNKIDNIIITSTSEVYGTPKKMPINENNQIKNIKELANSFSNFSRMSKPKFEKNNIYELIKVSINLYKLNYKNVHRQRHYQYHFFHIQKPSLEVF